MGEEERDGVPLDFVGHESCSKKLHIVGWFDLMNPFTDTMSPLVKKGRKNKQKKKKKKKEKEERNRRKEDKTGYSSLFLRTRHRLLGFAIFLKPE